MPNFKKEASEVDLAKAAQAPLSDALSQAAARLTMFCSHFHQVLDLGVTRGAFAAGARSYYGRDVSATGLPDLSTYQAVGEAAQAIVTGETDRRTAEAGSYKAMALPNADEVNAQLGTFTGARNQSQQAAAKTDREREDVTALYPDAQTLAVDICDTAEYFHRKDADPASRRAKCRRWGVVYIYDQNEPTDPGDENAPTTGGSGEPAPPPGGGGNP